MSDTPPRSHREELLQLDSQRQAVMEKIEEAMSFLATTPVGLHGRLVDDDGFPRDDCDLYAVRSARNTVICGKNDIKQIEATMYEHLALLHEENKNEAQMQIQRHTETRRHKKEEDAKGGECSHDVGREVKDKSPFVRVVGVTPGSPGAEAGLAAGHVIVQYGDLDASAVAIHGISEMARVTASHEGRMLGVWVKHASSLEDEAVKLLVMPQRWAGDGLLGCAFEPIPQG